jgi:GDP/UDP-N,N'-diacetylbacillosamine 2-epimerase (hydrolysing)
MTRKICVITGSRAEYGLLRWVMQGIADAPDAVLQVVATGMHLSPEFGLTYREIERDGFHIDRKVEMLTSSDTPVGVAKSMGLGLIGFADVFADLSPDLIVVLGDRFEILAAVSAAMVARIPIAHIHGGEVTEGVIDEAIRHSITKMSHLHFVAADSYRQRVIQLGEQPNHVFMVGALGLDNIARLNLLKRDELEAALNFRFRSRNLVITFHPVTLEHSTAEDQFQELLLALDRLNDTGLIFTLPNADTDGRVLIEMIERFTQTHDNARAFPSLGQLRYLSCVAECDGVIGNSSSGIIEVPSLHKATINIGDRQRGRLQANSVINCVPRNEEISGAIARMYSSEFQSVLATVQNPYGDGGASARVCAVIRSFPLEDILKKKFFDLVEQ